MKAKKKFNTPDLFFNRELSWLEFNNRVLHEGLDESLPLLERLKFLSIVSSNLDEFFMVRVAGLIQQKAADIRKRDKSGLTPTQQLKEISERVHKMMEIHTYAVKDILDKLKEQGICVLQKKEWTIKQRAYLKNYFVNTILPVLTPLSMQDLEPYPLLHGRQIIVAVAIESENSGEPIKKIILIPVPGILDRFIKVSSEQSLNIATIEDVISDNVNVLFENDKIIGSVFLRITRDADVQVQEDEASDLLNMIEEAVLERKRRGAVRLAISTNPDPFIKNWLVEWLNIESDSIYEINGILDGSSLMQIANIPGFEKLKIPDWPPQTPLDLFDSQDIWQKLANQDVMLFHPYESFEPVVNLLEEAAVDPNVLAIKQTLYRTSSDSPIIQALKTASENGKEVTVLVELKARFDEARNINWARQLEDAGCHVIYGVSGLKTHAKAMLIIRRDSDRIRRYAHLATGNYNEKTARLYSDIGLLTSDVDLTSDIAAFFNLLTGSSEMVGWSKLTIAPTNLRKKIEELIEREIRVSTPDKPGLIMAKLNSLEDKKICQALYRASSAGVKILLNVRGICCLRPGLKNVSENIEVVSIVDRFLEHARIFSFSNGGHEEIYMSSADWMGRNLDKRLELLFPVTQTKLLRRLKSYLKTFFSDNTKSWKMISDGSYKRKTDKNKKVRAQEVFYKEAVKAAELNKQTKMKFIPITKPQQ
ncbi:MAG: polyphosphate kinase 1 [Sedimentisphaerales bacterium]|nr:polyphosphate kinase 1 [Sedimentisphaerales bacterium]